jgi:hypothetical protein
VTDDEFDDFIAALRAEMATAHQNPKLLRVTRNKMRATLPLPNGAAFNIHRDRLSAFGTAVETAAAVYAVYQEDSQENE